MKSRRRVNSDVMQRRTRDTFADTLALLRFLRENPTERFSAAALRDRTGVPKNQVRELLSGEPDVQLLTIRGKAYYQLKPYKFFLTLPAEEKKRSAAGKKACSHCQSRGTVKCGSCHGRGGRWVQRYQPTSFGYRSFGFRMVWETCLTCDGSLQVTCTECQP